MGGDGVESDYRKLARLMAKGSLMREHQAVAIIDGVPQVGLEFHRGSFSPMTRVVVMQNRDGQPRAEIVRLRRSCVSAISHCSAVDGGAAALRDFAEARPGGLRRLTGVAVTLVRRGRSLPQDVNRLERVEKAVKTWARVNEILAEKHQGMTLAQFLDVPKPQDPDVLPQRPDQKALDQVLEERGFVPASKLYAQNRAAAREAAARRAAEEAEKAKKAKQAKPAAESGGAENAAAKPGAESSEPQSGGSQLAE